MPFLLAHLSMIDRLKQQIAQLAFKIGPITAIDRVSNFIRLFNSIGRDAIEILFDIPRATGVRVAQAPHNFQQSFDPGIWVVDQRIISGVGHCSPRVSGVRCNLTNIASGVHTNARC